MEEDMELVTFDGDIITKSEIRDEIIQHYIDNHLSGLTQITDFNIGSEAYHLADVMANYILEHRELVDLNYRMSMIHTAEGEFLDNMGDMRGVHRRGSSPSQGSVKFTRLSSDTSSEITISDGTQVATLDAISFILDGDVVINSTETEAFGNVICEQEGAYTNVLPNTIVLVMGEVGSKVSVTNPTAFEDGEDIESDDDYRARILLSPNDVPCNTLAWYENLSNELESIHDTYVIKGETQLDGDIIINFNPTDRTKTVTRYDLNDYNETNNYESIETGVMTEGRKDLIELFSMKEYDVVGIERKYHLADEKTVLSGNDYIYGLVLETGYSLDMVIDDVKKHIKNFSDDASIGLYFNPSSLASIIENETEGVDLCKIVKKENDIYVELVESIGVDTDEVFRIDMEDIDNKIKLINFNVESHDYELQFSQDTYITQVGDTLEIEVSLFDYNNPISDAVIVLNTGSSYYTSITNQQGIATFNISNLSTSGKFTFIASYGSLITECEVINGIFVDSANATWTGTQVSNVYANGKRTIEFAKNNSLNFTLNGSSTFIPCDDSFTIEYDIEIDGQISQYCSVTSYPTNMGIGIVLSDNNKHIKCIVYPSQNCLEKYVDGEFVGLYPNSKDFGSSSYCGFSMANWSENNRTISLSNFVIYKGGGNLIFYDGGTINNHNDNWFSQGSGTTFERYNDGTVIEFVQSYRGLLANTTTQSSPFNTPFKVEFDVVENNNGRIGYYQDNLNNGSAYISTSAHYEWIVKNGEQILYKNGGYVATTYNTFTSNFYIRFYSQNNNSSIKYKNFVIYKLEE